MSNYNTVLNCLKTRFCELRELPQSCKTQIISARYSKIYALIQPESYQNMSVITDFQLGIEPDSSDRLISEIWNLTPFWLEHDHKYIQWLFPIDTQTKFNRHAPTLTGADLEMFSQSDELKSSQRQSLNIMLRFFGMKWAGNEIMPQENINIREHIWLKRSGHNHLRISRIIRSLALCGHLELSQKFQLAMLDTASQHGEVSEESQQYWRNANVFTIT